MAVTFRCINRGREDGTLRNKDVDFKTGKVVKAIDELLGGILLRSA